MATTSELQAFMAVWEELKQEVLENLLKTYGMPIDAKKWVQDFIEYNCTGGKLNRGLSLLQCSQILFGPEMTAGISRKVCILGWCIEWLQASCLVIDDIMDQSAVRRRRPCWYRNSKVQMIAINDSFLLVSIVFQVIRNHFHGEDYYADLIELFRDVIQKTELGQLLDATCQPHERPPDLSRFTTERYEKIVTYKTAFYTFYMPVACAMLLRGLNDSELDQIARSYCIEIGIYFQIQDDFLDCYGDPAIIGKVGTDIQENKCTWLVVQACIKSNHEQKKLLKENYGRSDSQSIEQIKNLYNELKLPSTYKEYEQKAYHSICQRIAQTDSLSSQMLLFLLQRIYKREK
uniref:Farnesyl pyrophosphate synthetase putative n=1 Tax=Albugo laibachii Nc14 TaxID=890382 RepID=F0WZM9_9STRA|nr:farnesyl pyrophosphate synthetase putative [Albugo laibachii Nc14]|eukprot:CCA26954.1 farnesyl pyrophosphate synthetase putative [Albugo laibachii Nc14]